MKGKKRKGGTLHIFSSFGIVVFFTEKTTYLHQFLLPPQHPQAFSGVFVFIFIMRSAERPRLLIAGCLRASPVGTSNSAPIQFLRVKIKKLDPAGTLLQPPK